MRLDVIILENIFDLCYIVKYFKFASSVYIHVHPKCTFIDINMYITP